MFLNNWKLTWTNWWMSRRAPDTWKLLETERSVRTTFSDEVRRWNGIPMLIVTERIDRWRCHLRHHLGEIHFESFNLDGRYSVSSPNPIFVRSLQTSYTLCHQPIQSIVHGFIFYCKDNLTFDYGQSFKFKIFYSNFNYRFK